MVTSLKSVRYIILLAACLLPSLAGARATYPPPAPVRYGFRWDNAWNWEQLEARAQQETPEALEVSQRLRRMLPLPQARLVMRHLAALPALADVRRLPDRTALDRRTERLREVRNALTTAVSSLAPRDGLADMLVVAERLADARARLRDPFLPDRTGRPYRPGAHPVSPSPRLRIRFDFTPAIQLLQRLSAGDTPDAEWERMADRPAFRQLLAHRGPARLKRAELMEWWRRAQDPAPMNRLYEWVYAGSYFDFGGVAVQAEDYRALIKHLQTAQLDLVERVRARLDRFLPDDLEVDATIRFLFAADADGWAAGDGLGIALEHFGDDYDRLARVLAHECFHQAQTAAMLPIFNLASAPEDRLLCGTLFTSVWREGIASYVGPAWPASPSREDLARSFDHFEKTFHALYVRKDRVAYREHIREGLLMAGSLYRVGWRMAQVIERQRGSAALTEIQTLGPAIFFARYVDAYRSASRTEVPDTERFTPVIEATIQRISTGLDTISLLEAAGIMRRRDAVQAGREAEKLAARSIGKPKCALALVLLGDFFARKGRRFALAERYLVAGLREMGPQAGDLIRQEGYLLLSLKAVPQAISVFRVGVETAPNNPQRHYWLGEGFRLSGDTVRARESFRRALTLDSRYEPARRILALMGPSSDPR